MRSVISTKSKMSKTKIKNYCNQTVKCKNAHGIVFLKTQFLFACLCSIFVATLLVCGCQAQQQAIPQHVTDADYPNKIAEDAQVNSQYKDISDTLANDSASYFFEITKVPHPSKMPDKILAYLQTQLSGMNLSPQIDSPSNCLYVDIPASQGCEDKAKVILQAHMDMVTTVADSYTNFDAANQGVEAVCDEETGIIHSKDYLTNIGADDGCGMALMLALAKNQTNFNHPAIRLLFTTDEELGLVGASKLSDNVLDADYLINIDSSYVGQICVSSAGSINGKYSQNYQTTEPQENDRYIQIDLKDLQGGHTAGTVTNSTIKASHLGLKCLNELAKNSIPFKLASFESGNSSNSFPNSLNIQFYVDKSKLNEAKEICQNYINTALAAAKDENEPKFNIVAQENDTSVPANISQKLVSENESRTLTENLANIPDGVIAMSKVDSSIPESSCAIGKLILKDGNLEALAKLRSANDDVIEHYKSELPRIANTAGVNYVETSSYYAFMDSSDTALSKKIVQSFKDVCNIQATTTANHGGLEMSWFARKHPGIEQVSVGFDIKDEHKLTESYYKNTSAKLIGPLVDAINNIK